MFHSYLFYDVYSSFCHYLVGQPMTCELFDSEHYVLLTVNKCYCAVHRFKAPMFHRRCDVL